MVRAQIESVISRVLRNQIDFLHAIGDERFRFLDDVGLCAAAMRSAHPRNDAKAARMVAALGNLDVGEMFWRQTEAWGFKVGNESWTLMNFQNRRGWRIEDGR